MVPRIPSWTKGVAVAVLPVPPRPFVDKRWCSCSSPCPSASLRGQKVLQLQFSVSLRVPPWTKGVAVAVLPVPPRPFVDKRCCSSAVLRGPPWPFVDKRCCSCSSPCPSVALRGQKVLQFCSSPWSSVALRGQKVLQLQFSVSLRGPSWTKGVAVAVLRVPPWLFVDKRCCSCSSPWSSASLRGQKVLQLQFSVSLRGSSWTKSVAVAVLRGPPWPFVDKRCCSSAVLRVPPWPFVDKRCCSCSSPWSSVALRGQKVLQLQFSVSLRGLFVDKRCCSSAVLRVPPWLFVDKKCCSSSSPWSSVALRGQKVLQFCSSPCPSASLRGQKVLQLQFSVSLRVPSWTKGVAVAVLRVPPWPFVDKRCCSCSSPCPSVALRGQKVLQLQFSVSLRPFVDKRCCSCSSPCPSVDQKTVLPALSCILVDE